MQLLEDIIVIVLTVVPAIAALGKWLDVRSAKRQEANHEFNTLLLWGVESIGNLTAANTSAIKNPESAGAEMEAALAEYHRFHTEIEKFKNKQAAKTL